MNNHTNKPKQTASELIEMLRDKKGVAFNIINETDAKIHLIERNNYLRTASYRKNYDKHTSGPNEGKYIQLEFAYLIEMSKIDMYLRSILLQMCIDVEHAIKVAIIADIENNPVEDGYSIVRSFLSSFTDILQSIESKSDSVFTGDLINKYFDLCYVFDKNNNMCTRIKSIDCPAWVLVEVLAFNNLLRFLKYYNEKYNNRITLSFNISLLNTVRSLRNACAHNNCILNHLRRGNTIPSQEVSRFVASIPGIGKEERKNKLSCRPLFEIVTLIMVYNDLVSDQVRSAKMQELKNFVNGRMTKNIDFFNTNQVISTSFAFLKKVVDNIA